MESLHWADQLASKIIERSKLEKRIPNIKCQQTPSGGKHIGNLNDVSRAYYPYKSIKEQGYKCTFVHTSDDRDPMKEVPRKLADLDGKWHDAEKIFNFKKYIGVPYFMIPDPFGCCSSWSKHFTKVWMQGVNALGMNPKLYYINDLYNRGKFEKYILTVFKKRELVGEIVAKFQATKTKDYIPFDAICPNCGKLANINDFDLKTKKVFFTCGGKKIKKLESEGCGYQGSVGIKQGKLQWRFEWPALWGIFNTTYEPFGKDHAEGSWPAGKEIAKEIYEFNPPIPFVYEFFLVSGQKMSASKGNVYIVQDMLNIIEPEVMNFFYVKRPEKQRNLDLKNIFQLVDEFDLAERIYFGEDKGRTENREENYKRMYELSQIKLPKKMPIRISYKLLAEISQVYDQDSAIKKLRDLGHLMSFDKENVELNKKRFVLAKNWLNNYAPEEIKFKVNYKIPEEVIKGLSEKERVALKLLKDKLKVHDYNEGTLFNEFYNICNEININPKDFFKAAYLVIINKEKGPRLASLILAIGKEKVIEILKQID